MTKKRVGVWTPWQNMFPVWASIFSTLLYYWVCIAQKCNMNTLYIAKTLREKDICWKEKKNNPKTKKPHPSSNSPKTTNTSVRAHDSLHKKNFQHLKNKQTNPSKRFEHNNNKKPNQKLTEQARRGCSKALIISVSM